MSGTISNVWRCETCPDRPEFDALRGNQPVMDHLSIVHQIAPPLAGSRQMNSHWDGKELYSTGYSWIVGDVRLTQVVTAEREPDDPMRFDE